MQKNASWQGILVVPDADYRFGLMKVGSYLAASELDVHGIRDTVDDIMRRMI